MNESKPKSYGVKVCLILAIICVVVAALSETVFNDWLIIRLGVRSFTKIYYLFWGAAAICAAGALIAGIPSIKFALSQRRTHQQRSQFIANYAEDADSPELTRRMLLQLQRENAAYEAIVQTCLHQMDRMDELQARQERLLETNAALYLDETKETLARVERRICRNMRNIINLCIAADGLNSLDKAKLDQISRDTETKLVDASELIRASADRINQYIMKHDDDSSEVQRWIKVIRDSLKED